MLGQTPEQFWAHTPAETDDLLTAFRIRENRRLKQVAFELSLLVAPHVTGEERENFTTEKIFIGMPGTFIEESDVKAAESATLSKEGRRRRAIERQTRPN